MARTGVVSVRIPASSCGLFGFKPTRARLPDGPYAGEGWGGMAIDGFLTWSVRDTAVIAGRLRGRGTLVRPTGRRRWGALRRGHHAPTAPPQGALCETTFTGEAIHPECRHAVHDAARLLADLGHHVEHARPAADVAAMMRAWTDIVAVGTALSIRKTVAGGGRPLGTDEVEGVARGAIAHTATLPPDRYLEAVGEIHGFGRQMAAFFEPETGPGYDILLSATLAEPPARVGRFAHATEDYVNFRIGPGGVFEYSPFCAVFNASASPPPRCPCM